MKNFFLPLLCFFISGAYAQNVGISDQLFTPHSPLHIHRTSNGNLLQLTNPTTTNAAGRGLLIQGSGLDFSITNYENGYLRFQTNNLERMRITNVGLVGIRTTAPNSWLHVNGDGTTIPFRVQNAGNSRFTVGANGGVTIGTFNDNPPAGGLYVFGNTGLGIAAPLQRLHVNGNAQIDGYLRVGNAPVPSTLPSNSAMPLFRWTQQDGLNALLMGGNCGAAGWSFVISGLNSRYEWDNVGSRSHSPLISPWIWLPTSSNGFRVELSFYNNLENGYDGVYVQYTTDGVNWTTLNSWAFQGYTHGALTGSNNICSGNYSGPAWSNTGNYSPLSNTIATSGTWIRFRIVGTEDTSNNTGRFELYGFTVWTHNSGSVGGAYATGNIYAERNVYAGSNVLLGDVAEYFPVEGFSKPGYLISLNPSKKDNYIVSRIAYDQNIIGIHSTDPTVTLNDPNSGIPVALAGRVPVWFSDENGTIQPGDYLTASSKQGFAMKAEKPCYIIGQALEFSSESEQLILCLVKQGWYAPNGSTNFTSGEFFIPEGRNQIQIKDNSVSERSKIFLTMLGDPGSRFWISEKKDGEFTIQLSEPVPTIIYFDYFVENATTGNSLHNHNVENTYVLTEKPADYESGNWNYDPQKNIYWRHEPNNTSGQRLPVEFDDTPVPPAIPQNPENGYVYEKGQLRLVFENLSK